MGTIRVGNAPCSWGSLEFEGMEGKSIGYAQMLDELVETGYHGTELGDWGFMPKEPDELRMALASRGLTMLGAFVPCAYKNAGAHEAGAREAVKIARLLAAVKDTGGVTYEPYIVLADENGTVPGRTQNAGRVTPSMGLDDAAWATYARGVEHVAKAVRDVAGLRCVFHHHCAGYVETPDEIAQLLDRTNPDLVGLVFDTGHYAFGAGNATAEVVLDGLKRFADRIGYVHFKDCEPTVATRVRAEELDYFAAVREGVFCELGQGCVDFAAVKSWMEAREYDGWLCVEQDVLPGMGMPKESARRNRDFLAGIGL